MKTTVRKGWEDARAAMIEGGMDSDNEVMRILEAAFFAGVAFTVDAAIDNPSDRMERILVLFGIEAGVNLKQLKVNAEKEDTDDHQ